LLITAAHVVRRFNKEQITARFPGAPSAQFTSIGKKEIEVEEMYFSTCKLPDSEELLDIAILCLKDSPLDTGLEGNELSEFCFEQDDTWFGRGYPKLDEDDCNRAQECVGGSAYAHALADPHFSIKNTEETLSNSARDWQGISGGPVVCKKYNKLVGIISYIPKVLPDRIKVVSIPYLLAHDKKLSQLYKNCYRNAASLKEFKAVESRLNNEIRKEVNAIYSFSQLGRKLGSLLSAELKLQLEDFEEELDAGSLSDEDLAIHFIEKYDLACFLNCVEMAMVDLSEPLKKEADLDVYEEIVGKVESLASRLVVKSISFDVLSSHQLSVGSYFNIDALKSLPVTMCSYAEALVSRWLGRGMASYCGSGEDAPESSTKLRTHVVFDGHSEESNEQSLLIGLYKSIYGDAPPQYQSGEDSNQRMLQAIRKRVNVRTRDAKGKPDPKKMIYYLVNEPGDAKSLLEATELLRFIKHELDGRLRFFNLNASKSVPLGEDEELLLNAVNLIFDLRKQLSGKLLNVS